MKLYIKVIYDESDEEDILTIKCIKYSTTKEEFDYTFELDLDELPKNIYCFINRDFDWLGSNFIIDRTEIVKISTSYNESIKQMYNDIKSNIKINYNALYTYVLDEDNKQYNNISCSYNVDKYYVYIQNETHIFYFLSNGFTKIKFIWEDNDTFNNKLAKYQQLKELEIKNDIIINNNLLENKLITLLKNLYSDEDVTNICSYIKQFKYKTDVVDDMFHFYKTQKNKNNSIYIYD